MEGHGEQSGLQRKAVVVRRPAGHPGGGGRGQGALLSVQGPRRPGMHSEAGQAVSQRHGYRSWMQMAVRTSGGYWGYSTDQPHNRCN